NSSSDSKSEFVVLKNLTKNYGVFRALDKVSFDIKEGEIFGYIGPNGAGKTTTMKILVGLTTDFQGEVLIGGYKVPKQKDEIHKLLGYLPQNVAFQEWRTVNHALNTFGRLSGLDSAEIEDRIPQILDLLALSDVRHKKISQLSGGMTQKVGLAQALLHNPKLLVLDEPLGGLDPISRRQFKEIVLELGKKGTTILFSSHILSDVQDVADRIGIISRGHIKQIGTLNELKSRLSPQKVVEVLLAYASDKWQEFKSIENVKGVEQSAPGRVLVILETGADADKVIDEIVQSIVRLRIKVRGVTLLSPSLDEIYFNYVQEGETV
ncbi:ABC transporter ATP-binding protein, partial [Candidatus Bathyarchaeota archaeon]|nr:ABC transporter ATP-binding protein [Candidatus Bathyarchaeota archaeon]